MAGRACQRKVIGWTFFSLFLVLGLLVSLKLIYPLRYTDEIDRWATARSLDPYLVAAVIRAESCFRPWALSRAGAIGLMQITPMTGQWIAEQVGVEGFAAEDLYRPALNIRFGTWYLRYLLERLDSDTEAALIAYNAGLSNFFALESGEGTLFSETEAYLVRVKRGWVRYRFLYRLPLLGPLLRAIPI